MSNLTPPHNAEAERAVLGSILIDTTGIDDDRVMDIALSAGLTSESFYDDRNALIFSTMRKLGQASKPLDAVTLREELNVSGKLEAAGGDMYIQSLVDDTPNAAHVEHYINIVREKHLRRTMIQKATQVLSKCYDENEYPDPQAVLGDAEKSFLEINLRDNQTMEWSRAVDLATKRIDALFESGGQIMEGLSTGLKHLDEKLMGLKPSEMIVIAARPSVGKTSLAMNIAESVATGLDLTTDMPIKHDGGKKHPVLVFSLEMPIEALSKRMIAGKAGINSWRLARGLIPNAEKIKLTQSLGQAADILRSSPIYVDDTASLDVMDLRARARRHMKQHKIELIVIDYLQLCQCREAAKQGRQIEVSRISQQIKAMAKELKIPVIVLSQLSRANEQRGDKFEKPKLSDLRDSGAIEQDADVVFLLRRPSRNSNDPESKDETLAIIDVAKNRNGETGEVRCNFFREWTRFQDRAIDTGTQENLEQEAQYEQGNFPPPDPNF